MDLKCQYPSCNTIFFWSGRGCSSHYCKLHRKTINQQRSAQWSRDHKKHRNERIPELIDSQETIVRPLVSHKFSGPGLFEPLPELINRALTIKSHTLGMPKSFMVNTWLRGQAGQQFVRSFMNPGGM